MYNFMTFNEYHKVVGLYFEEKKNSTKGYLHYKRLKL